MKKDKVIELIENAKKSFFVGALDSTKISSIEAKLNVKLPESYKWFFGGIWNWWCYRSRDSRWWIKRYSNLC